MTHLNHHRHQARDLIARRERQAREQAPTRWWRARSTDGACRRCGEIFYGGELIQLLSEDKDGNKTFQHLSERECWNNIQARRIRRRAASSDA